jgi:chemotaxis protein methyltransferase WspC
MPTAYFETLLAARLGFNADAVGRPAVANAIRRAMAEQRVSDIAAYARLVVHDAGAWETLVDHVVVPETLFFRDATPFELVAEFACERRQREAAGVLRVLSCPCSSGEEAYSLAITLLDGGTPRDAFSVRAVDVSRRAVRRAAANRFPANSFRGADLSYRDRYFEAAGDGMWKLQEAVAELVSVQQGNMLAPDLLAEEPPFDVVFCRNLLIYLHAQAKAGVMAAVRRLLAPNGLLVVGHAEAAIAREHGFRPVGRPGAFAFSLEGARRAATPLPRPRRVRDERGAPLPAERVSVRIAKRPGSASFPRLHVEAETSLARASELADAGRLVDALRVCAAHLERTPDSADGHFLMGVLRDAMGERRLASVSLTKALYLDPAHLAALQHLALTREADGDFSGAALLRARARRAGELAGGG